MPRKGIGECGMDSGWPLVGIVVGVVGVVASIAAAVFLAASWWRRASPSSAADKAIARIWQDTTLTAKSKQRASLRPKRSPGRKS
jgi:hypothetical protein